MDSGQSTERQDRPNFCSDPSDSEPMYLVISTSLNPDSRSRVLARSAHTTIVESAGQANANWIDLAERSLPACNGADCYGHAEVVEISAAISAAHGILIAAPIYNYDLGAAAKNLIELTGKAWTEKIVGFACAAGGQGSYMAPMQLANSLMLDFRSMILPQFVYATGDCFQGDSISDSDVQQRVTGLANELVRVATALN